MKIVISRTADKDLMMGFRFYKKQGIAIGNYFINSLLADIDSLVIYAGIHRKINGFHCMLSRRFPFAIYYKIEDSEVRVRRVLDCRRNPDWIRQALGRG